MVQIFFQGDKEEMLELEKELRAKGLHAISNTSANLQYNWTEELQTILVAVLGSTVLATSIQAIVKAKSASITVESDANGKKLKVICPRNSLKELKEILKELEITPEEKAGEKESE